MDIEFPFYAGEDALFSVPARVHRNDPAYDGAAPDFSVSIDSVKQVEGETHQLTDADLRRARTEAIEAAEQSR